LDGKRGRSHPRLLEGEEGLRVEIEETNDKI
jgi:hypothetical protein